MAPFCLLVFFIGSDRAFNFPEDLAGHFADRSSQHIGGSLRIKIKNVQKILVLKIVICIAHRPGKDGICDADSGSSLKGSSDVVEKNACRFCDYAAACLFEEGRGGDCRRWLPSVKSRDFWKQLEEETDGEDGA